MLKAIHDLYDSLADYLTFEELVGVDAVLITGGIAAVFYTGKYVIDMVL